MYCNCILIISVKNTTYFEMETRIKKINMKNFKK